MSDIEQAIIKRVAQLVETDPVIMADYEDLKAKMIDAFGERGSLEALDIEASVNALVSDVLRVAFWAGVFVGRDPWSILSAPSAEERHHDRSLD